MVNQKIFAFFGPLFISAVLLMIAVIAIAIWFQKISKQIEAEIGKEETSRDKVSKMTVKSRKKENKYSKSKKRSEDLEPQFYDSPPMRDEHREILKMKTLQNQEDNESDCLPTTRDQLAQLAASHQGGFRQAVTMPRASNIDLYIECIGGADQNSQKMTTFQNEKKELVTQVPQKYKSQVANMPRTFERDDIDGNANLKGYLQARSPNPSTLPMPTFSPDKEGYGPGLTSRFRAAVPQQPLSHNTNNTSTNGHDQEEMYEIMEHNSDEIYENSGYMEDTSDAVYGNQEVIEQENKRRSQHNAAQVPENPRNWNSQATQYQGSEYEEELYGNQEIVEEHERRKHVNTYEVELYENYVAEDMYENC